MATSERGFEHYDPIPTSYGHDVRIYESSSANEPRLWMAIEKTERSQIDDPSVVHLTFGQAEQIIQTLQTAMAYHYQLARGTSCPYSDPHCPCNDPGESCNYRPVGDSPGWSPPDSFWRPVPCGHPAEPVAWVGPEGPVCHCGIFLDVGTSTSFVREHDESDVEWPLVSCSGCGCLVAVPQETER